ncbi:MAG TPA: FAD-binding oxidoreductase [Thermoanaerobaculia bacterium]|jgi:FAD/FMN-containing dehydrogenase|nr:FAD-binding oxidoreductase [Thermoanaerobaculia bacterium]
MNMTPRSVVDPSDLAALTAQLRGPLLLPGDAAYDEARTVWNAMIDRRPAAIARPLGTDDVRACVRFAGEHGLTLAVKGGGHNIAGLAMPEGGFVLDMSGLRGVEVDVERRLARIQAGALLGDVDAATQQHGLAATLGFVSQTGVAGLTLGGGFGYLTRRFGWTCDGTTAMDLVTAEGEVVRASEESHPELLWGLRGGGGNFGVVTGFEMRLEPVGPEILGGPIAWRAEEAEPVLELYRQLVAEAPPELTCVAILRKAPPAPWLPADVHGKPVVVLMVCWSGDLDEGERIVAQLRSCGTPVGNALQRRTYVSQQAILDPTQPKGRRYYWKSEYLPAVEAEALTIAMEHLGRVNSPHSGIIFFPIGGAIEKLPADHSAVGNRDARFVLNVTAAWEQPDGDEASIAWARNAWGDLRRFSTGGTYVNFLTEEEGDERVRAAYGGNLGRLAALKRQWDPKNLFSSTKQVFAAPPQSG